jgi:two-component sensor histidine kinase
MHRVLYVDDDEVLVQLVRRVLRRNGCEVQHAPDAESALRLVAGEPFDAVVLDHYLPGGTGHDVLRRMHEAGHVLPVVYVTASSDASVAVQALKSGAADYVVKTPGDEFLALLERSIRQSIATDRLRAEKEHADAEIRRAKERAEALLAEVNHRVANSLALVTSLLRLQAGASNDANVKHILNESCGRIAAIVNVHRSLYIGDDLQAVRMDTYLAALVDDLRLTMPDHVRLTLEAQPLVLRPDQAVSVGVIVTELASNAAKYAYPDGSPGEVRITLRWDDARTALLSVVDDGVGFVDHGDPIGTGLGQRIVRSMAGGLGADLEVLAGTRGTVARVRFAVGLDHDGEEPNASVA